MPEQGIRQDARRAVKEALDTIRKERVERDRRISRLAIALVTELTKRDQAMEAADRQAAATLRALLAEDLTLTEVAGLCGRQVSSKDLSRLSRFPVASARVQDDQR